MHLSLSIHIIMSIISTIWCATLLFFGFNSSTIYEMLQIAQTHYGSEMRGPSWAGLRRRKYGTLWSKNTHTHTHTDSKKQLFFSDYDFDRFLLLCATDFLVKQIYNNLQYRFPNIARAQKKHTHKTCARGFTHPLSSTQSTITIFGPSSSPSSSTTCRYAREPPIILLQHISTAHSLVVQQSYTHTESCTHYLSLSLCHTEGGAGGAVKSEWAQRFPSRLGNIVLFAKKTKKSVCVWRPAQI